MRNATSGILLLATEISVFNNKFLTLNMANLENLINLAAIHALEEAELANAENPRQFHIRDNAFELSEKKFCKIFRLPKVLVYAIIEAVKPHMTEPSRLSALDIPTKVLVALRFFASGSYQMDIGQNIHFAISQASVSRCITEFVDAVTHPDIMDYWVQFPSTLEELKSLRKAFYTAHHFPGVVGCVDCTHVAIFPPKTDDPLYPEYLYVNRKGYHSINVQLVCDWRLKILNVNSLFPGSTHDVYIWNNSRMRIAMEHLHHNLRQQNYHMLGDSGYPLRPWLLTPLPNVRPNTPEQAYNERQMSTRSIIERCNGVLKTRFRCLLKHRVLHYSPEMASKIINTCVVLHNMCIHNNVAEPEEEENDNIDFGMYDYNFQNIDQIDVNAQRINADLAAGRQAQRRVIRNYFT